MVYQTVLFARLAYVAELGVIVCHPVKVIYGYLVRGAAGSDCVAVNSYAVDFKACKVFVRGAHTCVNKLDMRALRHSNTARLTVFRCDAVRQIKHGRRHINSLYAVRGFGNRKPVAVNLHAVYKVVCKHLARGCVRVGKLNDFTQLITFLIRRAVLLC